MYTYYILGRKIGSIDRRNMFYIILGMRRSRMGDESSKQGLVLISMSSGLKLESMMKSSPKSSKLHSFLSF